MLYTESQAYLDLSSLGLLYSFHMSIGSRLRQLRTSHSMNQEQLGELCGVTKGMVSQWELDIVTPPTDRLLELHKKLVFSFDWLLHGDIAAEPTADYTVALSPDDQQILDTAQYLPPEKLTALIDTVRKHAEEKRALLAALTAQQHTDETREPQPEPPKPTEKPTSARKGKPYKLPEPGIAKPHAGHHKKRAA